MKIYVSKPNANYYQTRTIMVVGKHGDGAVRFTEGRQMGDKFFFDDRYFVMDNSELELNFEPKEGC